MTVNTDPPRLWDMGEVASYLRVPPDTVKEWRRTRKGPRALKIGRHLRWLPDEVKQWAGQQAEEPAPVDLQAPVPARTTAAHPRRSRADAR